MRHVPMPVLSVLRTAHRQKKRRSTYLTERTPLNVAVGLKQRDVHEALGESLLSTDDVQTDTNKRRCAHAGASPERTRSVDAQVEKEIGSQYVDLTQVVRSSLCFV